MLWRSTRSTVRVLLIVSIRRFRVRLFIFSLVQKRDIPSVHGAELAKTALFRWFRFIHSKRKACLASVRVLLRTPSLKLLARLLDTSKYCVKLVVLLTALDIQRRLRLFVFKDLKLCCCLFMRFVLLFVSRFLVLRTKARAFFLRPL